MKSTIATKTVRLILVVCLLTGITVAIAIADGHDWLSGELRVDLPEIYNAGDYQLLLKAATQPSYGSDFTTAWLSVNLGDNPGLFTQVGLLTESDGIHWFVYTEAGAVCVIGTQQWGTLGCEGNAGDLVSLNNWYRVEIVSTGGGVWVFRLYDTYGTPHNLASTWVSGSTRIYAATATQEESYTVATDPYLPAAFYLWHPQYKTASGWKDWPQSSGGNDSIIRTTDLNGQNTFCPQVYGVNPNFMGDERAWYAGINGQQCSWVLFPSAHSYLPLIIKPEPTPRNTPCFGC